MVGQRQVGIALEGQGVLFQLPLLRGRVAGVEVVDLGSLVVGHDGGVTPAPVPLVGQTKQVAIVLLLAAVHLVACFAEDIERPLILVVEVIQLEALLLIHQPAEGRGEVAGLLCFDKGDTVSSFGGGPGLTVIHLAVHPDQQVVGQRAGKAQVGSVLIAAILALDGFEVGIGRPLPGFARLLGDDVDDTTDGIGAIKCRHGATDHLDPLDHAKGHGSVVEVAAAPQGIGGGEAFAIHQH